MIFEHPHLLIFFNSLSLQLKSFLLFLKLSGNRIVATFSVNINFSFKLNEYLIYLFVKVL